jgi:hypothetical protein
MVGRIVEDLPLHFERDSGVIGSSLGGFSTTGVLGSNLPLVAIVNCNCFLKTRNQLLSKNAIFSKGVAMLQRLCSEVDVKGIFVVPRMWGRFS